MSFLSAPPQCNAYTTSQMSEKIQSAIGNGMIMG